MHTDRGGAQKRRRCCPERQRKNMADAGGSTKGLVIEIQQQRGFQRRPPLLHLYQREKRMLERRGCSWPANRASRVLVLSSFVFNNEAEMPQSSIKPYSFVCRCLHLPLQRQGAHGIQDDFVNVLSTPHQQSNIQYLGDPRMHLYLDYCFVLV